MVRFKAVLIGMLLVGLHTSPGEACHRKRVNCPAWAGPTSRPAEIKYCFYARMPDGPKQLFGPYTLGQAIKQRSILHEGGWILDPYLLEC